MILLDFVILRPYVLYYIMQFHILQSSFNYTLHITLVIVLDFILDTFPKQAMIEAGNVQKKGVSHDNTAALLSRHRL